MFGRQEKREVFCEEEGPDGVYGEGVGQLGVVKLGRRFLGVENSGDREGEAEVMKIGGKH